MRHACFVKNAIINTFAFIFVPFFYFVVHLENNEANAETIPGTMNEKVNVDQNGAFSISIPVSVPPGINVMQPKLSIYYNSQSGNGLLGMGWALNGLSVIERTKPIIAIDGYNGTVSYTSSDRFTLNGDRLIGTLGTYGAAGSQYHTQIESWQQVTSYGTQGSGPQYFMVQTKNGMTLEFGNTTDSRPLVADGTVSAWYLNKVTDLNNNVMTVTYSNDPAGAGNDNRAYPVTISYTANATALMNDTVQANRTVSFVYVTRPDILTTYVGGVLTKMSVLLSEIHTTVSGTLVGDLRMVYSASTATGRSLLNSVALYPSADANAVPINPSSFSYQAGSLAFDSQSSWLSNNFNWQASLDPITSGDVNGDGFLDLIGFHNGVQVALGGSSNFATPSSWSTGFSSESTPSWSGYQQMTGDINGDGLADIVGINGEGVVTAISTGSAFTTQTGSFPYFSSSQGWNGPVYLCDVNGDNMLDLVGVNMSAMQVVVALADPTTTQGFQSPVTWLSNLSLDGSDNFLMADMNGDGNADLVDINASSVTVALSTGSAFSSTNWSSLNLTNLCGNQNFSGASPAMLADVNGDGLSDVIAFCSATYVALSNGAGLEDGILWNSTFGGPNWSNDNLVMLADVNGDGMADLVGVTGSGTVVSLSTGQSFVDNTFATFDGVSIDGITTFTMGDINADGLMDLLGTGNTNVNVALSSGSQPDLMTSATTSAGAGYAVTYAPLSDSSIYSETGHTGLSQYQNFAPFIGSPYPNFRPAARLGGFYHVVASLTESDNPAVGTTAYTYSQAYTYQNGLYDLTGRGWMGFATVTTSNAAESKQTTRTFNQAWPLTGTLASQTISSVSGSAQPCPLTSVANTYAAVTTVTSTPVSFVQHTARTETAYQTCSAAHQVGTTFAYDSYGNVTTQARLSLVDSAGNAQDASDTVYTLTLYQNDTANWVLGYPLYRKVSSSATAGSSLAVISQFTSGTDVSLTSWTYDGNMNLTQFGRWDDGNGTFVSETYGYDGFGNRTSITAPSGTIATSTYETTYYTYPSGASVSPQAGTTLTWTYGYDPRFGTRSVTTDPNGVSTITCYDAFGRQSARQGPYPDNNNSTGPFDTPCASTLVTATAPTNVVNLRQNSYVWSGSLPTVTTAYLSAWPTSAESEQTYSLTQSYDGRWRPSTKSGTDPAGNVVVFSQLAYDSRGRPTMAAVPYAQPGTPTFVQATYDQLGRTVSVANQVGGGTSTTTQSFSATAQGFTVDRTFAAGTASADDAQLSIVYAANRKRITGMQPTALNTGSSYGYDLLGRTTSLLGPQGQDGTQPTYGITYDAIGRKLSWSEPTRGKTVLTYGTGGYVTQRTEPAGSTSYTWDGIGRLLTVTGPDMQVTTFTYDGASSLFGQGRRASATTTSPDGTVLSSYAYAYDAYGRPASVSLTVAGSSGSYTTTQAFDPAGRLLTVTNPDSSSITTAYSGLYPVSVALGDDASAVFSNFAPSGRPGSIVYGNKVTASNSYLWDGTLLSESVTDPNANSLLSQQFNRDANGMLSSVATPAAPSTPLQSLTYSGPRLTQVTDTSGGNWSLAYDDAGNMTSYGGTSYTYSGTTATSATGTNGFTATYDTVGNMVTLSPSGGNTTTFTYDVRSNLVSALASGDTAGSSYLYDHKGRRIVSVMPDGTRTVYVSPWYRDVVQSGQSSPVRTLWAFGAPVAQWGTTSGDSSQFYLHTNHQRSVVMTTGSAGTALTAFSYAPQGSLLSGTVGATRYLFTGRELDPYTGMYWMGYRFYHPLYGRFAKADNRLGAPAARQDALNDNAYVLNSPATFFDPNGHASAVGPACEIALQITLSTFTDEGQPPALPGERPSLGEIGTEFLKEIGKKIACEIVESLEPEEKHGGPSFRLRWLAGTGVSPGRGPGPGPGPGGGAIPVATVNGGGDDGYDIFDGVSRNAFQAPLVYGVTSVAGAAAIGAGVANSLLTNAYTKSGSLEDAETVAGEEDLIGSLVGLSDTEEILFIVAAAPAGG